MKNSRLVWRLLGGFLMAALLLGLGGGTLRAQEYILVTDASDLEDGDEVLIVSSTYYAMAETLNGGNAHTAVAVTVSNNTITDPDIAITSSDEKACVFTLKKSDDGKYAFYDGVSQQYLAAPTTMATPSSSSAVYLTVTIDGTKASINNGSNEIRLYLTGYFRGIPPTMNKTGYYTVNLYKKKGDVTTPFIKTTTPEASYTILPTENLDATLSFKAGNLEKDVAVSVASATAGKNPVIKVAPDNVKKEDAASFELALSTENLSLGEYTDIITLTSGDIKVEVKVNLSVKDVVMYQLVTDAASLKAGDEVLIVGEGYAMTAFEDAYVNRVGEAVTIADNKIIDPTIATEKNEKKACVLTLEKNAAGNYAFHDKVNDNYLSVPSGSSNTPSSSTASYFSITIDASTGTAEIKSVTTTTARYMRYYYDGSDNLFKLYTANASTGAIPGKPVYLYKKQGGDEEPPVPPAPFINTDETEVSYTIQPTEKLAEILSFTAGNLEQNVAVSVASADEGRTDAVIKVAPDNVKKEDAASFELALSTKDFLSVGEYTDIITLTSGDAEVKVTVNLVVPAPFINTDETEVSYKILPTENLNANLRFKAGNLSDDVTVTVASADAGRDEAVIQVMTGSGTISADEANSPDGFEVSISTSGLDVGEYTDIITLTLDEDNDVSVSVRVNLVVKKADVYELVTDVTKLKHGDVVLIVGEGGYAMSALQSDTRKGVNVPLADSKIINPTIATAVGDNKACEFTLEKDAGNYAFKDNFNRYLTYENSYVVSSSTASYWSTTIAASGAAIVKSAGGRYMRYNLTSSDFYTYTSSSGSQKAVCFYKKQVDEEPTCDAVTLPADGAVNPTENSVEIIWDDPEEGEEPANGYRVTVTGPSNYNQTIENITETQINWAEDLIPETTYTYSIVAVCGEGFESEAVTGTFTTLHVDNPVLKITSPANNASFTGDVTFYFTTEDFTLNASHLVKVEVKEKKQTTPSQAAAPVLKRIYTQASPVIISGLADGEYHVDLYMVEVKENAGKNDTAVVGFDPDAASPNYVHRDIVVKHPAIYFSRNPLKITTYRGTSAQGKVTVTGHALPASTPVNFASNNANFNVTSSLTQAQVMTTGGAEITVTYNGAAANATATITATCGTNISATFTVNAIAKDTLANLKGLYSRVANDTVMVRGKMVVTHKDTGNNRVWVQDIDQKNGASMLLYQVTAARGYADLKVGDVLENVPGRLTIFEGLRRFTPLAKVTASEHNHAVYVDTLTADDINNNFATVQSALACVKDVTFNQTGNFARNTKYTLKQGTKNINFVAFNSADYVGKAIPTVRLYVVGVITKNTTYGNYIASRKEADMTEAPCPLPENISAEEIHSNKALLDWEGVAAQYSVRYAKTKAGLASATPTTVSESSFTATNLDELTTYYYQVKSLCSATNESDWSAAGSFTTPEAIKPTINMVVPVEKPTFTDSVLVKFHVTNVTLKAGDTTASIVFSNGHRVDNYTDTIYKYAMPSGDHSVQVILMAKGDTLHPSVQTRVRYFSVNLPDVAKPVFVTAEGHYKDKAEVTLSCATQGASIFYAKGEGEWVAYTAGSKIVLTESTTLKAFACKERMDTSEVATATYIIHSNPTPVGDLVFAENFSKSTTATTSTAISNFNTVTDSLGWSGENMFTDVSRLRGGSTSKAGKLVSPKINLSYDNGKYYVAFFAQAYNNKADSTKIRLKAGEKSVLVRDLAKTKMFEYVYEFNNGTANTQLTFEALAADYNRFYLDSIRVYQVLPPMLFAPATVSMEKTIQGIPVSKTVTVKGSKLTGDVTVTAKGNFTVSPATLDKDAVMSGEGAEFTVTYNGNKTADEVELTLASSGATKTIKVTAEATPVTEVADLSALRNGTEGNLYKVTGEVILTARTSNKTYRWIQDANAGILMDDANGRVSRTYGIGDGIMGVMGKLVSKNGQLQLEMVSNLPEASSHNNPITPIELTVPQLTEGINTYCSRVVKLSGLTLDDPNLTDGKWAAGQSYTAKDRKGESIVIYTSINGNFVGEDLPTGKFKLVGLAGKNAAQVQIIPRSKADFEEIPDCKAVVDLNSEVTGTTVTFSWSKAEGSAPEVGYAIEVRTNDAASTLIKKDTVKNPATLTYTLENLAEGDYTYEVTTLCSEEDASGAVSDNFRIVPAGKPSISIVKPSAGTFDRDSVMCIFRVTNFKLKGDDAQGSVKYTLWGTNLAAPVTAIITDTFFYHKFERSGKDTVLLELVDNTGASLETPVTVRRAFIIDLPDVATPTFTPTAISSREPIEVTIDCGTNGASIFYSLNNAPFVAYTGAIKLDTTGVYAFRAFATKAKMDTSKRYSKTYTLRLPKPLAPGVLFYEPFDNLKGASGDISDNLNEYTDRPGWTGDAVYMQVDGIARIGSAGNNGYLQTPAIALTEGRQYVLSFKAQAWQEDSRRITVTINGTDYEISGLDNTQDVVDNEDIPTRMNTFEKLFTATASTTIRFASKGTEGLSRFFLDNIKVVEATPSLSVSPARIEMETVPGTPVSEKVIVKGINLDNDVTVTCRTNKFSVSATTLTKEAVMSEAGAELTVTFNGEVSYDEVEITLTSGELTKTIAVVAEATEPEPEPEPEITVVATLTMNTTQGTPVSEKVTVKGKDLAEDVTITCPEGNFSVSPATLDKEAVMSEAGAELTVTFNGAVLSDNVEIALASSSATATVAVTATATEVGGDDPEPEITVVATLTMNTTQGTPVSKKVTVKGKDLAEDVTVTCPEGNFSVSPATLTKEAVMSEAGAELTVTFNGSVLSDNVEIALASGSATATVAVTATAAPVVPGDECEAPTQLKATVADNTVTLTWEGAAEKYRVVVTLGEKEVCNELVEGKSHELKNLEEGVYAWKVASVCEDGEQAADGENFEVKEDGPISANEGAEGLAFRIYPNPTVGAFYVEVAESARMEIFTVGGVMIRNAELTEGKNEIRLDRSGIYFVRLTGAHGAAVNRVIVR